VSPAEQIARPIGVPGKNLPHSGEPLRNRALVGALRTATFGGAPPNNTSSEGAGDGAWLLSPACVPAGCV